MQTRQHRKEEAVEKGFNGLFMIDGKPAFFAEVD
jgi:hypothetical protein